MTDDSRFFAVAIVLFFGALATQLTVVFSLNWYLRRDRYLIWFAGWALSAAALLLTQAAMIAATSPERMTYLLVLRGVEFGAVACLLVPPVCLLAGRRVAWWLVALTAALYALRAWLLIATDLVWAGDFDDEAYPVYARLFGIFAFVPLLVLAFLVPYVRRIRDPGQRRPLWGAMAAAALLVVATAVGGSVVLRELTSVTWSLPMVAALWLIGLRRIHREESANRRLLSRQAALLQLTQVQVAEVAVDLAADRLSDDLGRRVSVVVRVDGEEGDSEPLRPDSPTAEVVVHGGRFVTTAGVPGRAEGLEDDERAFVTAVLQVVTSAADRAAAVAGLRRSALYDALTGLPNRMLLTDRLEQAVERVSRSGGLVAVLFCDLDDFKQVNDRLGHAAGDAMLVDVGRALSSVARASDTVSRFGGDEFVVVAGGLGSPEDALAVGSRLVAAVREVVDPVTGTGVRMSVGVAVTGSEGASPTYLLRAADMAMYRAKSGGGGVRLADRPTESPAVG